MTHRAPSGGFAARFGYVQWLYHLEHGAPPTLTAIAAAVGRTQPSITGWLERNEAPTDFRVHAPLAAFFGIEKAWLVEGAGEPPRPELWADWLRRRELTAELAKHRKLTPEEQDRARKAAAGTAKKGRRAG